MAAPSVENHQGLSWFDFIFEEKGELLRTHLNSSSADPSAAQLIVQFLGRSATQNVQQTPEQANPVDSKRFKRLKQLALQVGFYMEWNLEAFEDSLSLHWQKLFFTELLKMQTSLYENFMNGKVCLKELDKKSSMALVVYCRWVIRTLAQHFLPNIGKPKTGLSEAVENENTLKNLKEQLLSCISILEDALLLTEDLELPCPLDIAIPGKAKSRIDKDTTHSTPNKVGIKTDHTPSQKTKNRDNTIIDKKDSDTDHTLPDKTETNSEKVITDKGGIQADMLPPETGKDTETTPGKVDEEAGGTPPGKADSSGVAGNKDEQVIKEETSKVDNIDDMSSCGSLSDEGIKVDIKELVAQISFDLGTLYFYQEKFEKAAKLFQHCKEAKCCKSSCYTVDEDMLHGYYMSCCGLLNIQPQLTLFSGDHGGQGYTISLFEKVQHCKITSCKDLIGYLVEDNITEELPMDYRKWLEHDVSCEGSDDDSASLQWQITACNAIRLVLQGKPLETKFWEKLRTNNQQLLECVLSLCSKTVELMKKSSTSPIANDTRFVALKSFVHLLSSCIDSGFETAKTSQAQFFWSDLCDKSDVVSPMDQLQPLTWSSVDVYPECERDDLELRCGRLLHKLRTCYDANEINRMIEQLHRLQPTRRFHNENFTCMTYKPVLDEVQDSSLQDLLHVIFTKSLHCASLKQYSQCEELLRFALDRLSNITKSASEMEKVKSALHQELLITDLLRYSDVQRTELINSSKTFLNQTRAIPNHKAKLLATTYLLNMKEHVFLSALKIDGEDDLTFVDYRKLGSLLASACLSVTKPQEWRKSIRILWDAVLRIFSTTVQQKRPQEGRSAITIRRDATNLNASTFKVFVNHLQDETCVGLLISCLVRLRNLSKEGQDNVREIFSSYCHLWPTSITNRSSVNFENIESAMIYSTQHGVTVHPCNIMWQQTLGDIFLDSKNFSFAFKCYLEAGACSSCLFAHPVPITVWDVQVFKKMIECCMQLKAHIQAALLCQCFEPKDYITAFKAIQLTATTSEDAMDHYYSLFWDVSMLEYLINTHFKQGQHDKKQLAIQTINQAELNIFNNQEVLNRAESIRRSSLFRSLSNQYL